ncbi:MAG: thioredoxin domain-containing protein [Desulfobacterales bacterium]|jgi:thioredoxin 2|nr:thioredoxin domain-containing protein [Desulfobacterales bacterium]
MDAAPAQIVRCPECKAGNRLTLDRFGSSAAKCGKCKAPLFPQSRAGAAGEMFKLRCAQCGARNRVPGAKLGAAPKCGKCGALLKTDEVFAPQPVTVTDANFEARVLQSPLPVLLFAWAPWCPTCLSAAPMIDQFATEVKGRVRVGKLNVDVNPNLAGRFNIMSVPFLFIFDNGQMKASMPGVLQKHELMLKLAPYV